MQSTYGTITCHPTGDISYPKPVGFELDSDAVLRVARLFVEHIEGPREERILRAVEMAVHQQLAAFHGAASVRRMVS